MALWSVADILVVVNKKASRGYWCNSRLLVLARQMSGRLGKRCLTFQLKG